MDILVVLLLAVSLSMDAFAVSLCKGLALRKLNFKSCCIVGAWFGGFQALMPVIGYLVGYGFAEKIESIDHWIAFGLLVLIGLNMLKEAFSKKEEEETDSLGFKTMLLMAIATSIDALAVGVSFAFEPFEPRWLVYVACGVIGITTSVLSAVGVRIGHAFGTRYKKGAEITGGVILILLGVKILLEGLGILP